MALLSRGEPSIETENSQCSPRALMSNQDGACTYSRPHGVTVRKEHDSRTGAGSEETVSINYDYREVDTVSRPNPTGAIAVRFDAGP